MFHEDDDEDEDNLDGTQVLQISPDYSVGTCSPSSITPAVMPAQFKALSSESCARAHCNWRAGTNHHSDGVSLSDCTQSCQEIRRLFTLCSEYNLGW